MTEAVRRSGSLRTPSILYVDYEFPGVTTTFTWREVEILRRLGVNVEVLSTRPARVELLPPSAVALMEATRYVGKPGLRDCTRGLLRTAIKSPGRLVRCIALLFAPVRPLSRFPSYAFHLLWAAHVATTMELAEFDCVHAPFAAGQGSMAMFLGILIDRPLWITSHAYDIYADRIALRRKLKAARLFVTISRANRDWLVAKYGRAAQGVRVSYLGVDPRDIEYAAPQAISGPVDIVSVGSLNPKKGHDTLLRALHGLEHAGVDFKCSIIGEGAERPHLERLIEDLALGGKVTLMGSIPNDRTRQIVAASDLFVLACRHGVRGDMDGIPVALMEAMAMGVPVVSTRISGIPELVFDGDTGFLAKPGDPGSLHDALNRGIEREDVRREVSLRARALIETTFDQEANTKALLVMVVDSMRLGGE